VERRSGPRVSLDASAIIRIDSLRSEIQSRIINASEKGLLLVLPEARPVGTRIRVTVQIEDPKYEINVAGIIVHVANVPDADPHYSMRVGIFLTDQGPDWAALCRRLARVPGAIVD